MTLTTINLAALGQTVNLGTEVTGTLPTGNGGTGSTATTFVNAASNVTGTLATTNGGTGATSFSPGKLLQVVDNATTTVVTHSTSYADTTLNCSITPTATSSKIYILVTQCVYWSQNGLTIQLLRDSTSIFAQPVAYTMYDNSIDNARDIYSIQYLDSPSSTSAINYKTQCKLHSAGTIQTQESNQKSRITLMEIAG